MPGPKFAWDPAKARANLAKHGVSFEQARLAFDDPLAIEEVDPHPHEDRVRLIGLADGTVLFVVYTELDDDGALVIRIISAREATRHEKKRYYSFDRNREP